MELTGYFHLEKIKENSIKAAQCSIGYIVKQASGDKEMPSGGNRVGRVQTEIILSLFYSNLRLIGHKKQVLNTFLKDDLGILIFYFN